MQYLAAVSAGRYDFLTLFSSNCNDSVKRSFAICYCCSYCDLLRTGSMQRIKIYSNIYFTAFTSYGRSYRMIMTILIII